MEAAAAPKAKQKARSWQSLSRLYSCRDVALVEAAAAPKAKQKARSWQFLSRLYSCRDVFRCSVFVHFVISHLHIGNFSENIHMNCEAQAFGEAQASDVDIMQDSLHGLAFCQLCDLSSLHGNLSEHIHTTCEAQAPREGQLLQSQARPHRVPPRAPIELVCSEPEVDFASYSRCSCSCWLCSLAEHVFCG